jgi:hypothetical protein
LGENIDLSLKICRVQAVLCAAAAAAAAAAAEPCVNVDVVAVDDNSIDDASL